MPGKHQLGLNPQPGWTERRVGGTGDVDWKHEEGDKKTHLKGTDVCHVVSTATYVFFWPKQRPPLNSVD